MSNAALVAIKAHQRGRDQQHQQGYDCCHRQPKPLALSMPTLRVFPHGQNSSQFSVFSCQLTGLFTNH
jgi:hypothetical protein